LKRRLEELTALIGVSAREDDVARYMRDAFAEYAPDVSVDMLGNVTAAWRCGKPAAQRVMIFAHMDEVGLMVKKVEPDGYLRMERLTAVNSHVIPGTAFNVRTHGGKLVRGVVGAKSHHFMTGEEKTRVPELGSLFLDIGCRSREQVYAMDITEGCVIAFTHNFVELAGNIVSSKSMDDRVGLLCLLGLAEHMRGKTPDFDLFLVGSVQEEYNIRGIMPTVRAIDPDIAIGLDITPSGDTPDVNSVNLRLGGGPAFTYMNYHGRGTLNGIVPNEKLVHFLERVCADEGIPFQREVCLGVLTETAYVAISGAKGVATANISVPVRYAHTPVETASLDDIASTIRLLRNFADKWRPGYGLGKI
jgi:putative aminopeptidase FrvX